MALPETPREVYGKNPLAEVVAQLRFPTILKIDAESPAAFQESIRADYSRYSQQRGAGQLPANMPPQIKNLIQGMGPVTGPQQHQFESQDQKWSVTLTRESISLKTTSYNTWEEFRDRLHVISESFKQIYNPSSYVRVGLRYVDVVRRSMLNLDGVPWTDLLNPCIAGELAAPEFGDTIDKMSRQFHCKLDGDNYFLTLKSGIALAEPDAKQNREKCFFIDSDFHTHKQTEVDDVATALNAFNRQSGNLFRWSIQSRLRDALAPTPIR